MSNALWCNIGGHAFEEGEEGSQKFQGSQVVNGRSVSKQIDVCAQHAQGKSQAIEGTESLAHENPVPRNRLGIPESWE